MLKVHSFKIEDKLVMQIKTYCAANKITMFEFVARALEMYLMRVLRR